jgi:hypothetical protein
MNHGAQDDFNEHYSEEEFSVPWFFEENSSDQDQHRQQTQKTGSG